MPGRLTGCNRWETRLTFWTRTGLAGVAYRGTACDTLRDATTGPARLPVSAGPSRSVLLAIVACIAPKRGANPACGGSTAATTRSGPTGRATSRRPAPLSGWEETVGGIMTSRGVTDLVVYGDTRPVHATAIAQARRRGITVHVFEEGYLRPYWVTYERGGANGNSPVMATSVDQMRRALGGRRHGPAGRPRTLGRAARARLSTGRFTTASSSWRTGTTQRSGPIARSRCGRSSGSISSASRSWAGTGSTGWRRHGASCAAAIPIIWRCCNWSMTQAFATMAPSRHKRISSTPSSTASHRARRRIITSSSRRILWRTGARRYARPSAGRPTNTASPPRVHFVRGGKLAPLLDAARSAVTVNSTAAQQALWRGLPLKCFGAAVYDKPEFVSDQPLAAFFRDPGRPDSAAYRKFRHYLLQTSQLPGSFLRRARSAAGAARRRRPDAAPRGRIRGPERPGTGLETGIQATPCGREVTKGFRQHGFLGSVTSK